MDFAEFLAATLPAGPKAHPLSTTRSCCGPSSLDKYTLLRDMSKWPSPGARARCLHFCVQSPGPARAGGIPRGSGRLGTSPGAQAGRCQYIYVYVWPSSCTHTIANYHLHVHTQLPIIYVGTQIITNCLCRWEPSAAPSRPPPPPPPPPQLHWKKWPPKVKVEKKPLNDIT